MAKKQSTVLLEYVEAMAIALVLAMVIRGFVVKAFEVPTGSMLETIQIGDHFLVNKIVYGLKAPFTDNILIRVQDPRHGDIVVFPFPENPSTDFVKRVIGVPGDVIEIRDKAVYRNGEKLDEPYTRHVDPEIKPRRDNFGPITVPEGKYFVMGDNRDESYDSRFWGYVDREKIEGKAWIIYWSSNGFSQMRFGRIGMTLK